MRNPLARRHRLRGAAALAIAALIASSPGFAAVCDIDADADVDRDDISLISAARNEAAAPGDVRDVDGDGTITVLDMRQCVVRCTLARCAIPEESGQVIDSAGGRLEFPGGLVLEVPAGALTEPVRVDLAPSDCGTIQPLLDDRAISTKPEKTCMAAFTGSPSGLEFALPVLATVPVPAFVSGTFPILADVDQTAGTYALLPTVIEYDAAVGAAQVQLTGFSEKVVIAVPLDPDAEFGPEFAAASQQIEDRCASCSGQFGNAGANIPFCENLDPFQTSCCLIRPQDRGGCYGNCFCCKEQRVRSVVSQVDFTSGDCQLLGSDITVTYPDCPGAPTYIDTMDEASPECPQDLIWEISVNPTSADALACQDVQFEATIRGLDPDDGSEVIAPATLFPTWVSTNDTVARFVGGSGLLRSTSAGNTVVEARIAGSNPAVGQAPVTIRSNIESFAIDPASVSLEIDEEIPLQAAATAVPEASVPPNPAATSWSVADPTIVDIIDFENQLQVTGRNAGNTSVTASLDYSCETVTATADVTVDCRTVDFSVSPATLDLIVGDDVPVAARALDADGNPLDVTGVGWRSEFDTVVGVFSTEGPQTRVQAFEPTVLGPVAVIATYDDGCQTKEATVLVSVGCTDLRLSVEQGIVEVNAFLPIAVTAVDGSGNPVAIDENEISWTSSDPNIAAVIPSVGGLTNVVGIAPGEVTIEARFDQGPCGVRNAVAQITVRPETPDVSGTWQETVITGGQSCTIVAGGDTEQVNESWGGEQFGIAVSQIDRDISIAYSGFPGADPYTGAIEPTADPAFPWRFTASVSSNSSVDCRRFFDSGGEDIVFGQPACGGNVICQPTSCFETETLEGRLSADNARFEGSSQHEFEASANVQVLNDDGSVTSIPNAQIRCVGQSRFEGVRP